MLVLINLKNKKIFIEICFDKDSKVTKDIISMMKISKIYSKNKILHIFCNMFLDEYKEIFMNNKIDELFIINNEKFTKVNIEGLDIYPRGFYNYLLKIILDLDFTYEENLTEGNFNFEEEERAISKSKLKFSEAELHPGAYKDSYF
jgi:hypothetical protein